ncbi:Pentatricopeptide repeat, partial [Thalictrum thalictroides]
MEALDSLEKYGVRANSVAYSELIKCCVADGTIEQGKRVHEHVYSNGYKPKTFLNNFLLNMYIKFDLLDEALELFDKMHERNVVSWTTIISAYCKCKLYVEALKCLVRMQREGVKPNMFTLSTILRACDCLGTLRQLHCSIIKYGLDSDVFVRSALIDIYSKWGELDNGFCVFDEMLTGDLVVWNSIIGGFAQNGHGDKALDLFISMKRLGFQANQGSLTSVFRACTGLALLELGRQLHAHVIKTEKDLILNNAILDMYCKCGSLEDASSAFQWMSEKDVISWSTMISGLAQNGHSIEALKLFESMKDSGTKPNYITIVGVLFACSHAGLVDDGWAYFRSLKRVYGIDPRREHYGCMVDLLGRAGKFPEAVQFIHEMKCEPDAVIWRTLLSACK